MLDTTRIDQIKQLSPESRIQNSYEAMYYNVSSGDPDADEIVRNEIQQTFKQYNIILADNPDKETLRSIMLDSYLSSIEALGGGEIDANKSKQFVREFDTFVANHSKFYDITFESYERKYVGESVDFTSEYTRTVRQSEEPNTYQTKPVNSSLNMGNGQHEYHEVSGLSYLGHAPETKELPNRLTYQPTKQDNTELEKLKGRNYDVERDAHNRGESHRGKPGDDYAMREYKHDLKDDGPEL